MGESVGSALVVNRLVKLPLTSLLLTMPALNLLGLRGGDIGLVEKLENCGSSCGDWGLR